MKCSKCGRENPVDSDFCQYCGSSLVNKEPAFTDPENYFAGETSKPKEHKKLLIPLIVVTIVASVLAILNLVQYSGNRQTRATIESLTAQIGEKDTGLSSLEGIQSQLTEKDKTIEAQEEQISSLEKKNAKLESQVSDLEGNARRYEIIKESFDPHASYGFSSNRFKVNNGIVILERGTIKRLTLTADFDEEVEVTSNVDGFSADIVWNEDTWSGSTTTVDIVASETATGVTVINFSNDQNTRSFDVFVIVL